jgi:hypothetical protein
MSGELIAIIALLGVIGFQGYFIYKMRQDQVEREKDLLNRIMSRNYETFVQGDVVRKEARPLTPEEIYERELERGVPV